MRVRGLLFDIGGTLVEPHQGRFEASGARAAITTLHTHGLPGEPETLWRDLMALRQLPKEGPNYRQVHTTAWALCELAARRSFPLSTRLLQESERAFVGPEARGAVALPGALEVVRSLHGKVKLGAVSNTRSHLLQEETLAYLGVRHAFDPLVTSAACGWRKPSPRILQQAVKAWSLPVEQLVMIGDSLQKDVRGAKALGMRAIWLHKGTSEHLNEADAVAQTPLELLELLTAWLG